MLDLGKEARLASGFELRRSTDGSHTANFRGYASVTDHAYPVAGGPEFGGWTETVSRGAFKKTLGMNDNRALLYAHDNSKVVATTRAGSLAMLEDSIGLLVDAQLNTRVAWIADLVEQIESGEVDEMSIGFIARSSDWDKRFENRVIDEVQLIESTIVWAGANGATLGTIERNKTSVCEARSLATPVSSNRVAIAAAAAAAALNL